MNKLHCTAKATAMSKKHPPSIAQPRPVKVADKAGDELIAFPAERHILTGRQREIPSPAAALAELGQPQPSERARLRAASVPRPAPTVHDDLQAAKRRPWDAPMATPVHQLPQPPAPMICGVSGLPDPIAALAWDAVVEDAAEKASRWWGKWQLTLAFGVWSLACFSLGVLSRG